ncbi:hypothetical protein D3C87_2005680 [compost metagenome]
MRFKVAEALAMIFLPVSVEPVKVILSMPGWLVIQAPNSLPPAMTLMTPAGKMSRARAATASVARGVKGEGFRIRVLPV